MFMMIFLLIIGGVLLYFGAELLVKGSANLALRCGVSALVTGLTVVAFGTSAPELVVSVKATLDGLGDIAVGNVVGSNIFNIAIILGLSALVRPLKVHLNVLRVDTPVMIAASVFLMVVLHDLHISRVEAASLFIGIIAYVVFTVATARRAGETKVDFPVEQLIPEKKVSAAVDIIFVIGGLGLLILGSRFFVDGAVDLARAIGVSEAVIGLTIVAAGTSLPELATSIIASIKKEDDIAIGNIIGSNIFNILAILGVSGAITPLEAKGVGQISLYFMLGTAALLIPFMRTGYVLNRIEGVLLLLVYGGYMYYLWP
ncbi:MAG: calcium/sodium antiporter [Fibrobacter sp.]|jgi:cation:H+ antiporter|nr:calcium/sodium antiporter [Fibrobacter sp.]